MKMIVKILLWKFVEQRVEMKHNSLLGIFSICTKNMQINKDGKRKFLNRIQQVSEVIKKLSSRLLEKMFMQNLNMKVALIVYNEFQKQNLKDVFILQHLLCL